MSQQALALQKELAALRHSVTELNTSKLGRQDLKEQLADQRDNYQQMVNLLTRKLESRFTALEERVGQMERSQRRQGPSSAPAYPAPSDRPTTAPSPRPSIYD